MRDLIRSRRLWYVGGAAFALLLASFVLALVVVDAERAAKGLARDFGLRTGYSLTYADAGLRLLPVPVVRIDDVAVRTRPEDPAFLTVEQVRIDVSLLALFAGQTVLRSVDLRSPSLTLGLDEAGMPALPAGSGVAAQSVAPSGATEDEGGAPLIGVTSLRVRQGVLALGPMRLEEVELSGGGNLDLTADFDFEAQIPDVGPLRGTLELTDLVQGPVGWNVRADVEGLDLAGVADMMDPDRALYGRASGSLTLAGVAGSVEDASVDLALRPVDLRASGLVINGDADLRGRLGQRITLDLSAAEIRLGSLLSKAPGVEATLSAASPSELPTRTLRDVRLASGGSELRGELTLGSEALRLSTSGRLDFASLATDWQSEGLPKKGVVRVDSFDYEPGETLSGQLEAEGLVLSVMERSVQIEGPLTIDAGELLARGLVVEVEGHRVAVGGSYSMTKRTASLVLDAVGLDVESLSEMVLGWPVAVGRLYAQVELSGPVPFDDIKQLRGRGELEIPGGEFLGQSIQNALLSQMAVDGQSFQRLFGRFELEDGQLRFSRIDVEQGSGVLTLDGTVGIEGLQVQLEGPAQVFAEGQVLQQLLRVEGSFGRLRATPIAERGEISETEGRRVEQRMLQGILEAMKERGVPDDPDQVGAYLAQRARIEAKLQEYLEEGQDAGGRGDVGADGRR